MPAPITLTHDSLAYAIWLAAQAVADVLRGRNFTEALAQLWADYPKLSPQTRGAVQDLAYGCLRHYGRGDVVLAALLARPLTDDLARAVLLVALFRVETRPEEVHTTVDQAVNAMGAVRQGAFRGLANGVLRNYLRQLSQWPERMAGQEQARYQHPRWWLKRLRRDWPQQWTEIVAAGNSHPPMALRLNPRRYPGGDYVAHLAEQGISAQELAPGCVHVHKAVPVERLPGFAQGWVSVQDPGAQQAARLLDVQPGMRVLDACSAPGGKTAHILELVDAQLTALDADAKRLARVRDNMQRLGLQARTVAADCRDVARWWDGQPFERILADVPCSASGVARRHPDIKWLRRDEDIASFAATQASILDALWPTLAVGGQMLYATCSVFRQENQEQVRAFVARHPDCRPMPWPEHGSDAWGWQLFPNAEHDGFFYARLQKQP